MKYLDFSIKKCELGYTVTTPKGLKWDEIAVNIKTAKKWIHAYLIEQRGSK